MADGQLKLAVAGSPSWLTPGLIEWLRRRWGPIEAVWGKDREEAALLADQYHARWAYCDAVRMKREADIHGVVFGPQAALDDIRAAVRAGWSVLLDPACWQPDGLAALARAADKATTPFVMQAAPHRFSPAVVQLRELIVSGDLGPVSGATCVTVVEGPASHDDRAARMAWPVLDLVYYLCGAVTSVSAEASPPGTVAAWLRLESGGVVSLCLHPSAGREDAAGRLLLFGGHGRVELRDGWRLEGEIQGGRPIIYRPGLAAGRTLEWESGRQRMLDEFCLAIREGRRPLGHLGSVRGSLMAAAALDRSLRTGRPMRISLPAVKRSP